MRLLLGAEAPATLQDLWVPFSANGSFAPAPYIAQGYTSCDVYVAGAGGGGGGAGAGISPATEIVTNPGAEVDTSGWAAYLVGYPLARAPGSGHTGAASFKVTSDGSGAVDVGMKTSPRLPVIGGKNYNFSAWCWAPASGLAGGAQYWIYTYWFDAGGTQISSQEYYTSGVVFNTWVQYAVARTAPAGAASVQLAVGFRYYGNGPYSPPNGTVYYFDDISMKPAFSLGGGGGGAGGGGAFNKAIGVALAALSGATSVVVGTGGLGGGAGAQGNQGGYSDFNGTRAYGGGGGGGGTSVNTDVGVGGAGGGGGGVTAAGTSGGNGTSGGTAGGAAGTGGGAAGGTGASTGAAGGNGAAGSASGNGFGGGGGGGGGHGTGALDGTAGPAAAAAGAGGAGDSSSGGVATAPTGVAGESWGGAGGGGGGSADITTLTGQTGYPGDGNSGRPGGGGQGARGGYNGAPTSNGAKGDDGLVLLRIYA